MRDYCVDISDGIPKLILDGSCDTIANNVYLSLMVPQGSWFHNPRFGSRLHLLRRAKNTPRTALLAREYALEALRWLLDTGRASAVEVTVQVDRLRDPHRLGLLVEAVQADGRQLSFTLFHEVV